MRLIGEGDIHITNTLSRPLRAQLCVLVALRVPLSCTGMAYCLSGLCGQDLSEAEAAVLALENEMGTSPTSSQQPPDGPESREPTSPDGPDGRVPQPELAAGIISSTASLSDAPTVAEAEGPRISLQSPLSQNTSESPAPPGAPAASF